MKNISDFDKKYSVVLEWENTQVKGTSNVDQKVVTINLNNTFFIGASSGKVSWLTPKT